MNFTNSMYGVKSVANPAYSTYVETTQGEGHAANVFRGQQTSQVKQVFELGELVDEMAGVRRARQPTRQPWNAAQSQKDRNRQLRRQNQNALLSQLDRLLPPDVCNQNTRNGAGGRALGQKGRSLHNILEDARNYLRDQHFPEAQMVQLEPPYRPQHDAIDDATIRQGLMCSSQSIVAIELDMPGWTIAELNPGAEHLLGSTPWGDSRGQCLVNSLVHRDNTQSLLDMWAGVDAELPSFASVVEGGLAQPRLTIRLCSYKLVDPTLPSPHTRPSAGKDSKDCIHRSLFSY